MFSRCLFDLGGKLHEHAALLNRIINDAAQVGWFGVVGLVWWSCVDATHNVWQYRQETHMDYKCLYTQNGYNRLLMKINMLDSHWRFRSHTPRVPIRFNSDDASTHLVST